MCAFSSKVSHIIPSKWDENIIFSRAAKYRSITPQNIEEGYPLPTFLCILYGNYPVSVCC